MGGGERRLQPRGEESVVVFLLEERRGAERDSNVGHGLRVRRGVKRYALKPSDPYKLNRWITLKLGR